MSTVVLGERIPAPYVAGDHADVGLSVDQADGSNGRVGVAANDGVVAGDSVDFLQFRFAPDAALTGSVTESLPRADTAGGFVLPITGLNELGGFYVCTSRTYVRCCGF